MFNKNGILEGVCIKEDTRVQQLNNRIYERNIPSHTLQQQFDPRPVRTRQILFPTIECHLDNFEKTPANTQTPIHIYNTYNQHNQFNPGTSAPFSGYATSIDNESRLHNSFMASQKYTPQSKYIPSSSSDLYKVKMPVDTTLQQPYPNLFRHPQFQPFNPNCGNMGSNVFNNHTRQQVKNVDIQS